jgi:MFS family permease
MRESGSRIFRSKNYIILGIALTVGAGLGAGIATQSIVIGFMVGVGAAVIVGLAGVLIFDNSPKQQAPAETNYLGVGIAIGAGLGVAYGVVLTAATDNPAFLGVGIAVGTGTGISIGVALNERSKAKDA